MKPFATYERKGEKKGKRGRKWHIRWVGDQLAVFPPCVLYVLYMCQERGIKETGENEKKKTSCQECQHSDNFLPLAADWKRSKVLVHQPMFIYGSLLEKKNLLRSLNGWGWGGCGLWTITACQTYSLPLAAQRNDLCRSISVVIGMLVIC